MTREEIISGLQFTIDMFLFDPNTGETFTEPRNDMDKTTIDACRGAIELLKQKPNKSEIPTGSDNLSSELEKNSQKLEKGTTKNDLAIREFEEIVVEYPPENLCTYPEYKGKPYFSIKYKEGNDYIIGYGTYNPKVLSRYLRDYFISPVTTQEPRKGE